MRMCLASATRQPCSVDFLHGGDQKFSIRADRYPEMGALPFEPLGLSAGRVRKPERRAVVVRNRKTESLWKKAKACDG